MDAKITLTQWNKFGDHPLVTDKTVKEFQYQEAKDKGYGFINNWIIVEPSNYLLEINGHLIKVFSQTEVDKIFGMNYKLFLNPNL